MSTHYDVIIIGTGAGGGTLAYRLAPSGKRILLLERGDYVPREKDNWELARGQRRARSTTRKKRGTTRTASRSTRTRTTTSAATPSSTARRCFGCASGISASWCTTAACRPAWPIGYDELEPYYTKPSTSIRFTESVATIPPTRGRAGHIRIPPSPTSRAFSSCTTIFARAGLRPFHVPLGIMLDETNAHISRCIRCNTCDGFPCLLQRQERRSRCLCGSGAGASERVALDQRPGHAARNERVRPRSDQRGRRA